MVGRITGTTSAANDLWGRLSMELCSMVLRLIACCLLMLTGAMTSWAQSEVRGTWLTTTGPDQIASGLNTATVVNQLKNIGINTFYIESWKNGYTQYPSQALHAKIGFDRVPSLGTRNLLNEVIIQAHRNQQYAIAWFEYGFASQFLGSGTPPALNPLSQWAANNGWLLQNQSGQYADATNGFAWMNPAIPQVRQLLIDMILEAMEIHDLDGIQLDDRLGWPRSFGWDSTTAALYLAETGQSLPSNINNTAFRNWRQGKVTLFAQELSTAVRAVRSDIRLSVAPSVTSFSETNYNANWPNWVSLGLFDEYIPQVYRDTLSNFQSTLPGNITAFKNAGGNLSKLIIGLRLNGTGADTPLNFLQQQIGVVRSSESGQMAGHSIFYGKGLVENQSAMTAFYGGSVSSSYFPVSHRPAALIASSLGSGQWQLTIPQAGHYRVVAEIGGRWSEVLADHFFAGSTSVSVSGATQVEFLVDRRPYEPVAPPASIVQSSVFHSGWTGSGSWVDNSKSLFKEGTGPFTQLGFHHVINSSHGINGISFSIENLKQPALLNSSDFEFQQSPTGLFTQTVNPPSGWPLAPAANVAVHAGTPSTVTLTWSDGQLMNRWLRVTVKATANTGLTQPHTYYLGHLQGEVTGAVSGEYAVLVTDILIVRAALTNIATASTSEDIDKNGTVLVSDILMTRGNLTGQLPAISAPGP
jgi:uncharacterized lipoprotein YddW (UPF0748 family)